MTFPKHGNSPFRPLSGLLKAMDNRRGSMVIFTKESVQKIIVMWPKGIISMGPMVKGNETHSFTLENLEK